MNLLRSFSIRESIFLILRFIAFYKMIFSTNCLTLWLLVVTFSLVTATPAIVTTSIVNPVISFAKNIQSEIRKRTNGKFAFDGSCARQILSLGTTIDVANGISCLLFNKAFGTSQTFTPATAQLLGVVFLSTAAGKITTLSEGSEEALGLHCRNNILPLSILSLSLAVVPFPVKFNKMVI